MEGLLANGVIQNLRRGAKPRQGLMPWPPPFRFCLLGGAERTFRGSTSPPEDRMDANETRVDLAPADLEARPITMAQYYGYAPEKFELWDGYLFLPGEYPEPRRQLLQLLLVNTGLIEAVKLAPEAQWREALARVYGEK